MQIQKEGFSKLIWETKVPMYRLAYGILRNQQDAEDAVGEAIISAYEHLDSLKDVDKFKAWIMMITANEAKKIYRKRKRMEPVEDIGVSGPVHNDTHDELWEVVLKLEERYRSVIILYYYEQMKIREISNILHITEGTVKSRMSRAKQKLRKHLT